MGKFSFGVSAGGESTSKTGTQTTQRIFGQEAIDKTIYDILSSAQGLGSLADSENMVGGSNSSTKSLMTQDLFAKVAGEIAKLTAPEVTTATESTKKKEGKAALGTVICTELVRQGKLDADLYNAGTEAFFNLHPCTVAGYQVWAKRLVPVMQRSERLSNFFLPIARARYEMVVHGKFSFLGALTIYVGQPVCFAIGLFCGEPDYGHGTVAN